MRKFARIVAATLMMLPLVSTGPAQAFSLGGVTRAPERNTGALFIREKNRSIEPFAHVLFCTKTPSECADSTGPASVDLTRAKKRELLEVNRHVNTQINPRNDAATAIGGDEWTLAPQAGDCEDYAITKRHALIARGWPAAALRLAVAQTSWGEGHLVLIVRTSKGDMVLDNMTNAVRNWRKSGLRWNMIQATGNPRVWYHI
jgi:predicted transglutaminase-like cysteine proteinase